MTTTATHQSHELIAKDIIDLAHLLNPDLRRVDNRRKGRVARTVIEEEFSGVILRQRARFERGEDPDSPVDCAVYAVGPAVTSAAVAQGICERLSRRRR